MKIIFFSLDMSIVHEWKMRDNNNDILEVDNYESLISVSKILNDFVIIIDYDSVSSSFNKMLSTNTLPNKVIVLEKIPEIVTGKMLIAKGVKAYGNTRMLKMHYTQMIKAVENDTIWTYPELTLALTHNIRKNPISNEAESLIEHRLTQKEKEVIYTILEGLTNDAIAYELDITQRTVKAHISSIFSKLHVNDRVSLILLLKS